MSIYDELTDIRQQIEQLKGQMTLLEHSAALARIDVALIPEEIAPEPPAPEGFNAGRVLREAWEEVGLDPGDVTVLGLLGDVQTVTGFLVTPVVGRIPYPYPFRLSAVEVEELLEVPWSVFSERKGHRREIAEHDGRTFEVDFYQHGEDTIWGATARITRQLVELVEPSAKV